MISVYIHIPFCTNICKYCDFPKMLSNTKWIDNYLKELEKEIKTNYKQEKVKTLYIGGGTPSSLSINQLKKLFKIISNLNINKDCEITLEANHEDLTKEKLEFLKDKINRLSIGVQTFNQNRLKELGRKPINIENIKQAQNYFNNINIDLMYDFNNQTKEELKEDINTILKLNIPHISTYSLIIEPNTILYLQNYQKQEKINSEQEINKILKQNNYIHYEISNYAKQGYESKHNLTYWNNENYYGFGLGASGYIKNIRYENTRNLNKYLKGTYIKEKHILDENETLQNEFILGFRKIKGINKKQFQKKYKFNIKEIELVKQLLNQKQILEDKDNIYINPKYIYLENEILQKFLTSHLHKH